MKNLLCGIFALLCVSVSAAERPNVVFILCDDLGYGDVKCNNPECKIATPCMDRLAAAGMRFTDAHSTSSVCTPTRYSTLTGRYNWRSRLQSGVQGGISPPLIDRERLTVASFLKKNGYRTGCVGKWHLGMNWAKKDPTAKPEDVVEKGPEGWAIDYEKPIADGPNAVGFDYYFGISASLDMIPYTFIENDRVTAVPTGDMAFPMMQGKPAMTRPGPGAKSFDAIDVLPTLTQKAVDFIDRSATGAKDGTPFFLYVPLNAPHTPIVPTLDWQGKSGLNPYGDFVMQTDASIGQIADALDRNGLAKNTLLIVTSDNGCSPQADFPALAEKGHHPSAALRGHKADIFDGGHRVPFLARWPERVAAGTTSDQLVSLVDLLRTCSDIVGHPLPDNAGEDSVSFLPALLGKAQTPLREALVHHSVNGKFSIRQGPWKLELCPGSGGWSDPRDPQAVAQGLPEIQLYNLESDLGERKNLQAEQPDVVKRLLALLEKYVADGRSTPGAPQANDAKIDIWKKTAPKAKAKPKTAAKK